MRLNDSRGVPWTPDRRALVLKINCAFGFHVSHARLLQYCTFVWHLPDLYAYWNWHWQRAVWSLPFNNKLMYFVVVAKSKQEQNAWTYSWQCEYQLHNSQCQIVSQPGALKRKKTFKRTLPSNLLFLDLLSGNNAQLTASDTAVCGWSSLRSWSQLYLVLCN